MGETPETPSDAEAQAPETPSAKAIRLLGVKRIAARCDLTTDAIYKWPKQQGGTIPSRHQPSVLALAHEMGVRFTPADVIGVAEPAE